MLKKNHLFLVFFFSIIVISANNRDSLFLDLDIKVENRQFYMDIKEKRIDSIRNLLSKTKNNEERYLINNTIYEEYSTYRFDSAMQYVMENKKLVEKLNIEKYKDETTINISMLLSTTGMYLESIDNLRKINRNKLDSSLLKKYYSIFEWTYYAAGEYTNDSLYAPQYHKMEKLYRDSTYSVLPRNTERYKYYEGKILQHEGKLAEALDIFLETYLSIKVNSRLYAIITYDIANIYSRFGNNDMYEYFLALASISDQVCPLKENLAMQELALYLFRNKPKELDRAYTYIQCSMEDARFYNNRLRIVQISEKMPIILKAYQIKSEEEKYKITIALFIITILSVATIALLLYLYRQIKVVRKSRYELTTINKKLKTLNEKLNESNQTKEEYVGLFIDLCSSYINKLDQYRETVKRKLVAKQVDDLYRMVNSTRAIETEFDDFFESFDNAFLKLYPSFINDFNNLLLPNEVLKPKNGTLLGRDLRIFALIRLGINDSARIASFLRYSPQTVYNNRTKIRNKAKNRDEFEKDILNIGND